MNGRYFFNSDRFKEITVYLVDETNHIGIGI